MMGVGLSIDALCSIGIGAAHKDHPTLKSMFYFHTVIIISVAVVMLTVIYLFAPDFFTMMAARGWDTFQEQFPDTWQALNVTEALDRLEDMIVDNSLYVLVGVIFSILCMAPGLISS